MDFAVIKRHLAVVSGYTVITLITTYPLIFNFSSVFGPLEDNQMFIWNLWWFKYSILELHTSPFYTGYLFFPVGADLLFHTYSPLNNILALMFIPILGIIQSYNTLILLTFIIAAYGGFLVARELGISYEASFIAGLVFSFNPFHFAHASHHLNISSIHLIMFLLYFAIRAIKTGKLKFIITASLLLAANFYLDYYIFLFSIFILIPLLFFTSAKEPNQKRWHQKRPLLFILVCGLILTAPLSIPMIQESLSSQFEGVTGYDIFVADLAGFFFPHGYHWSKEFEINRQVNMSFTGNYWESTSYLGYVVFALAIWAVVKKRFYLKKYFITVGLLGIILALGSCPHFLGKAISFIKFPYYIIQHIPGLNAARSPGRFILLTYLALSVLSAVTVDHLLKYLADRRGKMIMRTGFIVLVAAIVVDYWSAPFEITKMKPAGFYQTLKSQPDDFAVMNLPPGSREVNLRYMYYQTIHQKPICAGQLARSKGSIEDYLDRWKGFEMTPEGLTERKIKYVILHGEFLSSSVYSDYLRRLKSSFNFVAEENNSALFEIY